MQMYAKHFKQIITVVFMLQLIGNSIAKGEGLSDAGFLVGRLKPV
jgi:hypothetical protein